MRRPPVHEGATLPRGRLERCPNGQRPQHRRAGGRCRKAGRLCVGAPPRVGHPPRVINDVDAGLRELVQQEALNGTAAEIAFEAPTRDWVARRSHPTVDLYLYDIREDTARRDVSLEEIRDPVTREVISRKPPARRFRLSYLVTAWTQEADDEHRLLSRLLSCFLKNDYIPEALMSGELERMRIPCHMTVGLPLPQDRSISDLWSALGGELKPSLDVVVTVPVDVGVRRPAAPAVRGEPLLTVSGPDGAAEGGRQRPSATAAPTPDAGQPPDRTHRVGPAELGVPAAHRAVNRGVASASMASALSPADPATQSDAVTAGPDRLPGRVIRVRAVNRP